MALIESDLNPLATLILEATREEYRHAPPPSLPSDLPADGFSGVLLFGEACVRCSMLRVDPSEGPRLEEIRDNLIARIAEAEREGWLGEVHGLSVSLAAKDNLAHLDAEQVRVSTVVHLGLPSFSQIAACTAGERNGTA